MQVHLHLPTSWNLLTDKQFLKVSTILTKKAPSKAQQIQILFALLNISWWQFAKARKLFKVLKYIPLSEILKEYNYIYKDDHVTKFLKSVRIRGKKYYGPKTALTNITIEEFSVTEDAFFMYYKTQNLDYLKVIAAVLYRKKENGKRIDFSKQDLDEYLKPFKHIHPKYLACIALSYKGSSLYIQSKYPNVFKKAAPVKDTSKLKKPSLFKLVLDMAGHKFGTLNETKSANIHDFLTELNNLLKPKE